MGNQATSREPQRNARLDTLLSVLAHRHRRRIVAALEDVPRRGGTEFPVEGLAAVDEGLESIRTEMYHLHLPKLADAGYIEWDRETDTIRHGPNYDDVASIDSLLREHADDLPIDWP